MKIAFDATVVHGAKSGVGYYSQELIRALSGLDGPERYLVFSHRPLTEAVVRPGPRVSFSNRGFCPARAVYLHRILPRILDDEAPDLVHYTNFLSPFGSRHPYVLTVHDMSLERHSGWHPIGKRLYTRRLVGRSAANARFVITNSEYSKWEIVRYLGIPEDRIRVTPLAPAPLFAPPPAVERARIRGRYGLDRPYFLYVGNIDPRKNLVRLVEAFSRDLSRNFDLVLAGTEWFGARALTRAVIQRNLGRSVRFLGYVPRRDLPPLMAESTAFVYPSLLEGFGMPVVEAMASGAPVITSQTTALGEVAGDGARLVDPESAGAIADAMAEVASNRELRAGLVARGMARARRFTWSDTARATLDVYREAVTGRSPRAIHGHSRPVPPPPAAIDDAVRMTCRYAFQFEFPMTPAELHERLFDVDATLGDVESAIDRLHLDRFDGYVAPARALVETRRAREEKTRVALGRAWPHLEFIARLPFVRMVALSGATAHGNMADGDIDLFAVVEDGRLWFVLGVTTVWFKLRGVRRTICLNYLTSERALPIPDTDAFTAQQLASLKPVYGKTVYDEMIAVNPFVFRRFPNFQPELHRSRYDEIRAGPLKRWTERILNVGAAPAAEALARRVLGAHLRGKAARAGGAADVVLDAKRIKLHMHSHRAGAMSALTPSSLDEGLSRRRHAVQGTFAPEGTRRPEHDPQVQHR